MIAHIFKLTQGCLCLSHFPIHNVNNKSTGTSTNNTVYARIHKCPDWPQGSYLLFVSGEQIECGAWHIHSQQMSGSLRAESLISMTEGPEHHLPPLRGGHSYWGQAMGHRWYWFYWRATLADFQMTVGLGDWDSLQVPIINTHILSREGIHTSPFCQSSYLPILED